MLSDHRTHSLDEYFAYAPHHNNIVIGLSRWSRRAHALARFYVGGLICLKK